MTVRMEAIITAFAESAQVDVADLTGHYGTPALRRLRKVLWVVLRDMTAATNGQIGAAFGGRDASTVSDQVTAMRAEAEVLEHAALELRDWRLRVEQRLRAADPRGALRLVRQATARGRPTGDEWDQLVATLVSVDALLSAPGLSDGARLAGLRSVMDRDVGGEAAA
jgi:hypothetical protein